MAKKRGPSKKKVPRRRHVKKDVTPKSSARSVKRRVVQAAPAKAKRAPPRTVSRTRTLTPTERGELKSALSLVRRHIKGYDPADGWKVKDLGSISRNRLGTLKKKAGQLKVLLRQPHDTIAPKTRKARANLYRFTRQKLRGAKHFIVHKPADNFDVRIVRGRVSVRGTFAGKVEGKRRRAVVTESAFFLFPHTATDERDAVRMLRDMLDDMPEGFYVVLTGAHGDTGEPVEKGALVARLRDYINRYQSDSVAVYDRAGNFVQRRETDTGFIQAITGFRHLSTTVEGMELQMQARDARRARGEKYNATLRQDRMSKKERAAYEAPVKTEAKRQARKKASKKGWATRRKARSKK